MLSAKDIIHMETHMITKLEETSNSWLLELAPLHQVVKK